MRIVRFVSDPTGYFIADDDWHGPGGWARARIGFSEKYVLVNLDQAYIIELVET